jgi:endonuclease/exonuclease/phosphatase (EEP) superfamily protein YafD
VFPYQALHPAGFAGKGLLSRYPHLAEERLTLYPSRPDLHTIIDIGGMLLTVIVAHPPPPQLCRRGLVFPNSAAAQIEALAGRVIAGAPALLMGDLNFTPRHPFYRRLSLMGLHDSFGGAGQGRGWTLPTRIGPSSRLNHWFHWVPLPPVVRIDYIWHTAPITTQAAWVGPDAGSDHLPVLARLRIMYG